MSSSCDAGAEILLETARFWASRAVAEADGKRHIRHVIGPDEYHEDVDDNAFTNVMARWNIARGLEAIEMLRDTLARPRCRAVREARARRGRTRRLARRGGTHCHRSRSGNRPLRAVRRIPPARAARSFAVCRPQSADRRGDRARAHAALAGGQAGRCGGTAGPAAGRVPGRDGRSEFPLLRAALRPWQFAQRGHACAGRGTAGRDRHGAAVSAPGRGRRP